MTGAAQIKAIPISLLEPHPKAAIRFEYRGVEPLAALMKSAVSEDTPNGQLVPGRVVPRDDGKEGYYWVYIGNKRFRALKLLCERTGDERFAVFYAYVDAGDNSLLQLFLRAKAENEGEKGEREGLSILEEVSGIRKIRDSIHERGELREDLRRLYDLSEKLSEGRLRKLYEVERGADFRFRAAHLESLSLIEEDREFYLAAASTAGFRFGEDKVEEAIRAKDAAYSLRWFNDVFPEYERPAEKGQSEEDEGKGGKEEEEKGEQQQQLPPHERDAFVVSCPSCGAGNLVNLQLEMKATQLPGEPGGEKFTATPDALVWFPCRCRHCARGFFTFELQEGKEGNTAGGSPSRKLAKPKKPVDLFDLGVDFSGEKNVWLKMVGGKVLGPLHLPPGKGRKKKEG